MIGTINEYLDEADKTDKRTVLLALNDVLVKLSGDEKVPSERFSQKARFILNTIDSEDEQHPHNLKGFSSLMESEDGYDFP